MRLLKCKNCIFINCHTLIGRKSAKNNESANQKPYIIHKNE
ncbi:hypothetical protein HMPREF3216_00002 [Gardnerella vaginalis]|uniref:Uncharacterized protein n=1 Tax=Gardnerella vaginalis TaxID=2702 RepID=A0A133NTM5_GARVA|nr:hypothetical protein HMPREF3216_00002 [Gardnerella vaginalis]